MTSMVDGEDELAQIAETERVQKIKAEVRTAIETVGAAELHFHLEGFLTAKDLKEIAQRFGLNITYLLPTETTNHVDLNTAEEMFWTGIERIMTPGEFHNIHDFISALSTRWMRLLMVLAVRNEEQVNPHAILEAFFEKMLHYAEKNHLVLFEAHTCPLALTTEGNMQDPYGSIWPKDIPDNAAWQKTKGRDITPEEILAFQAEKAALEGWLSLTQPQSHLSPQYNLNVLPNLGSYFRTFDRAVKNHQAVPDQPTPEVAIKFCLRRDSGYDQVLTNARIQSEIAQNILEHLVLAYQNKLIVGVDIAGVENAKFPLADFTQLFSFLKAHGIPYTVHAGEIKRVMGDEAAVKLLDQQNRQLAFDNLALAILGGGADFNHATRIGHAVRLLDDDVIEPYTYVDNSTHGGGQTLQLTMMELLHVAIKKGIALELNITSNLWTGVAQPQDHPIIRAIKGEHALFKQHPELHAQFLKLVIPCSDDPAVWATEGGDESAVTEYTALFAELGVALEDIPTKLAEALLNARKVSLIKSNTAV